MLLVFTYLPYLMLFNRDPGLLPGLQLVGIIWVTGTAYKHHAIHRSVPTSLLYWQSSLALPTAVVILGGGLTYVHITYMYLKVCWLMAGYLQRAFRDECGHESHDGLFSDDYRIALTMVHFLLICLSILRFWVHEVPEEPNCQWSRESRSIIRLVAASMPLILCNTILKTYYEIVIVILVTNGVCMLLERLGRVTLQEKKALRHYTAWREMLRADYEDRQRAKQQAQDANNPASNSKSPISELQMGTVQNAEPEDQHQIVIQS